MARRDLLTGDERRALFGVPLDHASLAKHYTVADEDRPLIEAKRGDANRLGFALHLALLRHPGFGIRHDDVVPDFLIRHLAAQLDIAPTAFEGYAHRAQTRLERAQAQTLHRLPGVSLLPRFVLSCIVMTWLSARW